MGPKTAPAQLTPRKPTEAPAKAATPSPQPPAKKPSDSPSKGKAPSPSPPAKKPSEKGGPSKSSPSSKGKVESPAATPKTARTPAITSPSSPTSEMVQGTPPTGSIQKEITTSFAPLTRNTIQRRLPRALELLLIGLNKEEEQVRRGIETHCAAEQCCIAQQINHAELVHVLTASSTTGGRSRKSSSIHSTHDDDGANEAISELMLDQINKLAVDAKSVQDKLMSALEQQRNGDRMTLERALVQCELQQKQIAAQDEALKIATVEAQGLRELLTRKLLRTRVENELLCNKVNDAIEAARLDLTHFRVALGEKIDASVLSFHKPTYNTALRELQEVVAETRQKVTSQMQELKKIMDDVCATDPVEAQGLNCDRSKAASGYSSMHSALPEHVRDDLQTLTKEQLLNLLDIASFETGVVEVVGRAVAVHRAGEYHGSVF